MNLLPHWVITDKFPAFYDSESATAIEQTARLYKAMQELISEYNSFVDSINQHISDFEKSTKKDYEIFTTAIRQEFQDFIDVVELKIMSQDKKIADAISYMKTNLEITITKLVKEMKDNGELTQDLLDAFNELETFIKNFTLINEYNPDTEQLIFKVTNISSIEKEIIESYDSNNESLTLSIS